MHESNIMKFIERLTEKTTRGDNWSAAMIGCITVYSKFNLKINS